MGVSLDVDSASEQLQSHDANRAHVMRVIGLRIVIRTFSEQ